MGMDKYWPVSVLFSDGEGRGLCGTDHQAFDLHSSYLSGIKLIREREARIYPQTAMVERGFGKGSVIKVATQPG